MTSFRFRFRLRLRLASTAGLLLAAACGSVTDPASVDGGPSGRPDAAAPASDGHITYTLGGEVHRIAARAGAVPENVSAALAPGERADDRRLNLSPDGAWYVLETSNLDPTCPLCLAVAPVGDPGQAELVRPGGKPITAAESRSAVTSGGGLVVYAASGGPNARDLFATERTGDGWSAPRLLTSGSPHPWNDLPAISAAGTRVLFDCGPEANAAGAGASICEVDVGGVEVDVLVTPDDAPPVVTRTGPLHHPDYAPDGSVVFEADWDGERIWRFTEGALAQVTRDEAINDNSPCVLPDGRVVSLSPSRPGNDAGGLELMVMGADGGAVELLLGGQDVIDLGLGCGE